MITGRIYLLGPVRFHLWPHRILDLSQGVISPELIRVQRISISKVKIQLLYNAGTFLKFIYN